VTDAILKREEFLARRVTGIGGSEWAMALGMSKYGDPLRLYLIKRGLLEIEETERMEMGRYMEPTLLQWYVDSQGVTEVSRGEFVRHPEHEFLLGNLDQVVKNEHADEWITDAKNVGFKAVAEWGDEGSDDIPLDALWQAHAYMYLKPKAHKVDFVVLRGGHWPPRIYTVVRDNDVYQYAVPVLQRLWFDHIVPGVPPSPDFASSFALEGVKAMFPPQPEKAAPVEIASTINVNGGAVSVSELAEAYDLLGKLEKEAGSRRKKVEAALRSAIGGARAGQVGEIVIDRIFNKGGFRPATEIKPYDYLRIRFPKGYETKITGPRVAALLDGSE
jgi:predicted phage-related endonuclease